MSTPHVTPDEQTLKSLEPVLKGFTTLSTSVGSLRSALLALIDRVHGTLADLHTRDQPWSRGRAW